MPKRILVIGAGIAGLATANALQQHGHDVTVLEERTDTSSGAGISIWPNALAALDEIGSGRCRSRRRRPHHRGGACVGATARGCAARRRSDWSRRWASHWSSSGDRADVRPCRRACRGNVAYGVSARSLVATADRRAGRVVGLGDTRGGCGRRRRRHRVRSWRVTSTAHGRPLRRLHGMARRGRLQHRPGPRRRGARPGDRIRPRSAGSGPHLLVRHRTGREGRGRRRGNWAI